MKKQLLIVLTTILMVCQSQAQTDKLWSPYKGGSLNVSKNANRISFPKDFQLYQLNLNSLKESLANAKDRLVSKNGVIITLPNMQGNLEQFEVFEASNFDSELQAQFPEIRAYAGKGIEDVNAQLRMSISPEGIQTMIFRSDKATEFMEPYSSDGKIYAAYDSAREKGKIPFTCTTDDKRVFDDLKKSAQYEKSSSGKLLTFRLAMSCTGEYAAYHGGTQALVLAAFNNTMTRVNGVYEKDLAIHMNLIASTTNVIYLNAGSDPYGNTDANYNANLQTTLTAQIGNANYDIGHLVSAIGNNGNAGCIGCVCDAGKGSGYTTSTAPIGDNFDIDFVAHEMGHQFGGTHSFSNSNEGSGTNVEVGSGVTIMGYAGITPYDTHLHSIDVFHASNIEQIQENMLSKTCPTVVNLTHGAPIVNAGANYTIPRSTPFILTGSATDPNGDAMNYTWEQNDDGGAQTNANSAARIGKPIGPNWVNYIPTLAPSRYFPRLPSIIANSATTAGLDITAEALSSVSRPLTFRLTARDNNILGGQTGYDDTTITVNAAAGPFDVTVPNTAVSWQVGQNQTVTWNVAGTTANAVNAANVDIFLSTDGGNTYPIVLATKVPNDGTETITVPNNIGTNNRVMVKGNNHIFFDISNVNFTIAAPASSFSLTYSGVAGGQNVPVCQGSTANYNIQYTPLGGFSGTTTFSAAGNPAGTTVSFTPPNRTTSGTVGVSITTTGAVVPGIYNVIVTGTSGPTTRTVPLYVEVLNASFGTQVLTSPADLATALSTTIALNWPVNAAASAYDYQVATDAAFTTVVSSGTVLTNTVTIAGLSEGTNYYWRVLPKNAACSGTLSSAYRFTTGVSNCANSYSNNTVVNVPDGTGANTPGAEITKTIVVPGTVTGNLNDIDVNLAFTHTYIEDLVISISHPDGTTVTLWNRNCDDEFSSVNVTFSDGNPSIPSSGCSISTGTFSPNTPLAAFNGKPAAGTYTLRARDYFNVDTGSLGNWSINLCNAQLLSADENSFLDFALFPNPNNGDFTVKFTSASSNDIKINVHDMRGRQVYEKSFSNTGAFNQNISLNKVESGIYLVSILDGDKKTVKRIVIQ